MSTIKRLINQPSEEEPSPSNGNQQTCPRCGQIVHEDYTCGCPERWENEGGAPAPDERFPGVHKT